jgi:hypothetical protein
MIEIGANAAVVTVAKGQAFYFKNTLLQGVTRFNTCYLPKHALGSPFARIWYGSYFALRRVHADQSPVSVTVSGSHRRGNFHRVEIPSGCRYFVEARALAGFCSGVRTIRTKIRFSPNFWLLGKHFFMVVEGPGEVLLYSESPIEVSRGHEFSPKRVLAFEVSRPFRAAAPQPTFFLSRATNLLSKEVVWRFLEEGDTVVESHAMSETGRSHGLRRLFEIALSILLP